MPFLADRELRSLNLPEARGLRALGLALGNGPNALEVAVTSSTGRPALADLRAVWKGRLGGRATPLLLVALYEERAALCGPSGDPPAAFIDLDPDKVERLCQTALDEPDRHAALRFLLSVVPEVEAPLSGLRNEGLFASHELQYGVPRRRDWNEARRKAAAALKNRGTALLQSLGFTVEAMPGAASILRAADTKIAVAVFLDRNESPEVASTRFSNLSPVSYALAKADAENLPYVIVAAGPALRLYPTQTGIGTGRRGRTETYAEIHLDLLSEEQAGYLWLMFSAAALKRGGTVQDILARSADYAADLGARLRDRIYEHVVPPLAEGILNARGRRSQTAEVLTETYQMALALLFRLLFVAYAEDKELLPYRSNGLYRARSLKQKARDLLSIAEAGTGFDASDSHWEEITKLFRAVDQGNREWGVPPYDGGLFSKRPEVSPMGAALEKIRLTNNVFGPILADLLLDVTPEGRGPVDFRSLGVREFGTIYEGLLENELSVAEQDLTITAAGEYRPAVKKSDKVFVPKGRAYLHNASGARKATGSYFTKHFAVEHLLDHALEPALSDHLSRLDQLDDRLAGDAFFDFRVADIAMGSGHFLVAAVDRIERAFSGYLAKRSLPGVTQELARLRTSAHKALGSLAEGIEIEDTQLLRRQIARRCVYGVDLNPIAVELARLSLWVHTFVPGLPLSFLDHNLLVGNSLVGIATIEEAQTWFGEIAGSLFAFSADALVGGARKAITRLARISDANAAEIELARKAYEEARMAVEPAAALFDTLAAARLEPEVGAQIGGVARAGISNLAPVVNSKMHRAAREVLKPIPAFHFPVAFPEVFLRERAGFDVIVGNPPWEEATVEEDRFWTRYVPGFHSLPQHEQESSKRRLRRERPDLVSGYEKELAQAELLRRVLTSGPFPGMGTGDPDVYKAFAWRFWYLACADGGRIGVVLPRSALAAKGCKEFRERALGDGTFDDITFLLNRGGWVFDDAEHRYTIALVTLHKTRPDARTTLPLRGPYASGVRYAEGMQHDPSRFAVKEVASWTDSAALPLLPSDESGDVFAQLRKAPRLDLDDGRLWRARPYRELDATNDKKLMKIAEEAPKGFWPVFKGESFDIWEPDTGKYYAWGDPDKIVSVLQDKRRRSAGRADGSAFQGFNPLVLKDPATLSCFSPRIAFRDVSRATDSRTVRAALLPPKVFITNTAPYFLWARGDERDQAFLLGVMCSLPLDWYARRFVEIHMNYHVLLPMPIPRPSREHLLWRRTVVLAGRLAAPDARFRKWTVAVGADCGRLDPDEKEDMVHELDAVVAHLYGLSDRQLRHIFETFHEGWAYEERLKSTLVHYGRWKSKL